MRTYVNADGAVERTDTTLHTPGRVWHDLTSGQDGMFTGCISKQLEHNRQLISLTVFMTLHTARFIVGNIFMLIIHLRLIMASKTGPGTTAAGVAGGTFSIRPTVIQREGMAEGGIFP